MTNELGTIVAFESAADLLGSGADTGVTRIFRRDRKKNALHQLTDGNGPSHDPWLSANVLTHARLLR